MAVYGPFVAIVRDIHDGDTIGLDVDLGFGQYVLARNPLSGARDFTCRLFGINAPELSTQAGKDALAYLETLVKVGDHVVVSSHGWDKYGGRYDGAVVLVDGTDLSAAMLKAGHAVVLAS